MSSTNNRRSCVVIGAGAAGLSAGVHLSQHGVDVTIVEANDRLGGRICQHPGWPTWGPIDLGAEYIHGSKTNLFELAKREGWQLGDSIYTFEDLAVKGDRDGSDYIHHRGRLYKMTRESECKDIVDTLKILEDINGLPYAYLDNSHPAKASPVMSLDADKSLKDYLDGRGDVTEDVRDLVRGVICHEMAVSMSQCGIQELARWSDCWVCGTDNYRMKGGYCLLIRYFLDQLGDGVTVKTSWPVTQVFYNDDERKVKVVNCHGDVLTAETAIVTLPHSILRAGDVSFIPPLPHRKLSAIQKIHMESSHKICCRFRKPFWPDFGVILCSSGFMGQIHEEKRFSSYSMATDVAVAKDASIITLGGKEKYDDESGCYFISGYQSGELAAKSEGMTTEERTKKFLAQLDEIFGSPECPTPATNTFLGSVGKHWSDEPYIRGAYISPSVGASEEDLRSVAASVGQSLFFAGEGTSLDMPACVEAAVNTGKRAAEQVVESY